MTHAEPLAAGEVVLRMATPPGVGETLIAALIPSSLNEASGLRSLSVFATSRTMPTQARAIVSPRHTMAPRLPVDGIRALRPVPDPVAVSPLDVVWHVLMKADGKPAPRPGAIGHAGITGLVRPDAIPRSVYRSYRSQLVDLARASGVVAIEPDEEPNL